MDRIRETGPADDGNENTGEDTTAELSVAIVAKNDVHRHGLQHMASGVPAIDRLDVYAQFDRAATSGRYDLTVASICDLDDETRPRVAEARAAGTRVLVLIDGSHPGQQAAAAAEESDGVLDIGEIDGAGLSDIVRRTMAGQTVIPSGLARELLARGRGEETGAPLRSRLTPRETDVLRRLVEGYSNKQIARRLGMSEHGVKRLVASILAKLNCPNRTLAVARALREGLHEVAGPSD